MPHDFFYFPKSDRRVIIILAVVAVCGIAVLFVIDSRKPTEESENICPEKEVRHSGKGETSDYGEEETVCLHRFDPNTVDSSTLAGFGLRPGQTKALLNYRRAGGKFRTPESLSRLYGWSDEDVERLLPYVYIGEEFKANRKTGKHTVADHVAANEKKDMVTEKKDTATIRRRYTSDKFQTLTKVDPNTADTVTLKRIPGIGTYISRGIIRYRERLGGFYSVE
ncbi:MAG: helix-hairpin-helix domain-containing protein [Prevotellaceae bacterium]|nr:helix-hairpin-helix domain-containing protein [Prevotellaceae bacterium]